VSLVLLCPFDLVLSPDLVFHYTTVWEIRQPSVKLLTCILRNAIRSKEALQLMGVEPRRLVCLTINFDVFEYGRVVPVTISPLVASGWSDRRVGLAPTGKAPPCHGARGLRTFRPIARGCRLGHGGINLS